MKGLRKMNEVTETKVKNNGKKNGVAVGAFVVAVVLIATVVIFFFSAKGTAGKKDITIEVVNSAESSVVYDVSTEAEFLRGAMDEADGLEYSGEEGDYGLMVKTVNGELADYDTNGAYWSFYVNGEYCNYGIDSQPVNDGDQFQIVYTAE